MINLRHTDNPEAMRKLDMRVLGMVVSDTGVGMLFQMTQSEWSDRIRVRLDQHRSGAPG